MSTPDTLFYASRPRISVDGQLRDELGEILLNSLAIEETTLGLFRCEARFLNWGAKNGATGFLHFDRDVLDFGKPFSVELGSPDDTRRVFTGRIMALEAGFHENRPPELTVLAEDRFQDLRMTRRTRSFENTTDGDAVRAIAQQHGLTPQIDLDGSAHRTLAQVNQSDLAFIRERVCAAGGELWIEDRTLHAQPRSRRSAATVSLAYGSNLLSFTALADLAHQRTAVKVTGWDVASKQAIAEQAGASEISGEIGSGEGGSAVLGSAIADRTETVASAIPLSTAEAQALAAARYRDRARRFVCASGIAYGHAKIQVGATVELSGLGPLFNGAYYVTKARHVFDLEDGYRTAFDAERPSIGG
jgi:phage protein D